MKPFVNFKIAEDGYSGIVSVGDDVLLRTESELMAEEVVKFTNREFRARVREELEEFVRAHFPEKEDRNDYYVSAESMRDIDIDAFMDRDQTVGKREVKP